MEEVIANHMLEIIFGLISAGALGFCKLLITQNKKLKEAQKEDQNRFVRQMILDELEPIAEEMRRMKKNLNNMTEMHQEQLDLIINSYKFRFIQLCKTHLRDGYLTQDQFDQITEMFKLYHGLGGNGQAEEYYNRVIELPIVVKDEK